MFASEIVPTTLFQYALSIRFWQKFVVHTMPTIMALFSFTHASLYACIYYRQIASQFGITVYRKGIATAKKDSEQVIKTFTK